MAKTKLGRISGLRKKFEPASTGMLEFETTVDEGTTAREQQLKENFKDRGSNLRNYLFNKDSKLSIISSTPKVFAGIVEQDFGEEFYIHEEELESYCEGFAESIIANIDDVYNEGIESDLDEENLFESALDDTDIKLSLYRSFKSLYDKWISNSKTSDGVVTSGFFYNNYDAENTDGRTLFEHFRFINRANEDIGGKAVIDIAYLSNLSNTNNGQGPTQSLYNSLTNLLSKNNFDFWPLPSDTPLYLTSLKDEDIKDMFRANDFVIDTKNGPMFNCVHIGGSSRTVADISGSGRLACKTLSINKYKDDSFDIGEPSETPKEFLNPDKGVVSFKVRYGQEAQNHFQTLDIDQTEFKETQESLQIIDALTNPKTGSQPSQIGKGNSMYDVYLTRSYNCSVKGLGNMSIQPLMYFTLENVPMFRGTYLITGVKHEVVAHNHTTTFTGMRQPKITVPIVTDALSILDLALTPDEAFEGDRINLTKTYGSNFEITSFTSKEKVSKGCEIANRLVADLGLTIQQACGVVGNLIAESGLVPDRIQGSGMITGKITESGGWNGSTFPKGAAVQGYGWAQWTYYSLKNSFIDYAKTKGYDLTTTPANDEISYGYLLEWITKSSKQLQTLKTKNSVYDASVYFAVQYERCARCKEEETWNKRASFAQQVYDFCTGNQDYGDNKKEMGCENGFVPFGLKGKSDNINDAKNVIVGSSTVGTLSRVKTTSGSLVSNQIYIYYNCGGKTRSWVQSKIMSDPNKYPKVKSFFMVGIGTNDGYKVSSSISAKVKEYTMLVQQKFPNAKLYVLPGTYGWGYRKNDTLDMLDKYYEMYTSNGWILLWPESSGTRMNPNFSTSALAHNKDGEWFKKQVDLISQNKS